MRTRSIEGWGTDMRRSEWKFRELKPYQVMITMNDQQCNPNMGSNDVTLPRTPWPSLLGLLSSKTLPLQPLSDNQCQTFCQNRFYFWTSSMKPAAVPKSGPGQNWLQNWRTKQGKLSTKSFHPIWRNKNQKNIPFPLPCRCHLMSQNLSTFSLFHSFLIWCVKKMIYSVSNIDIWCVIDWSNVSKTSSFVLLSARLWLGCCCPNLRWARFGRLLMAGAFSSFLPVQNDLLWFSREIYIPTPVTFSTFTILSI